MSLQSVRSVLGGVSGQMSNSIASREGRATAGDLVMDVEKVCSRGLVCCVLFMAATAPHCRLSVGV